MGHSRSGRISALEAEALDAAVEAARDVVTRGVGHAYGAALVSRGRVVAVEGNRVRETHDPTAHAEVRVIRARTAAQGDRDLSECTLVATAEPCHMCSGALEWAGVRRLVVGARDPVNGGLESLRARRPELDVVVVDSAACRELLEHARRD
jgi:tRNA(Arg) A34 adenosine deaminase TadA